MVTQRILNQHDRDQRIRDAAPDMLAALQAVARILGPYRLETGLFTEVYETLTTVEAAIARATGQDTP